ncbi:MAG: MATE family efflux transporter [Lachnospiraceae bacterium]
MQKKSHEIDMCNGPLLGKILLFAIPVMLSGILQLLFNAADVVVVGRFAGKEALAAVGSTNSLVNLLVNVFIGLSIGTNVLVARFYGAHKEKDVEETVHTAILASVICGILLIFIGWTFARPILVLMGSPEEVLPLSELYLKAFFLGMPASMLYNFGSAILRAVGDTRRPLYFLMAAGIINVGLNLVFVIVFHLSVVGVGAATAISQCVSAFLIIRCLINTEGMCQLHLKKLRIHKQKLIKIIQVGLPAGMQGAIFSLSNVLIQSSVNSFGAVAMAGNTAGASIEGFVYTSMNALHQTAVSFISQNLGAEKFARIKKILFICIGMVTATGLVMGLGAVFGGQILLRIYSTDASVIQYGILRMSYICAPYFLCGIMDVMVGAIRGLGYSVMPMIVSLLGACAFRVVWIYTVFESHRTLECLYLSYPISWTLTAVVHMICFIVVYKKMVHPRQQLGIKK